jgi:hypothetical protein
MPARVVGQLAGQDLQSAGHASSELGGELAYVRGDLDDHGLLLLAGR